VTVGTLSASAGFLLANNTCDGAVLTFSATCTVDAKFKPTSVGAYSGQVSVPFNLPASPVVLPLTGSGSAGTELLTNGSFETDVAAPLKVPDDWIKAGTWAGADGRNCSVHRTGAAVRWAPAPQVAVPTPFSGVAR
jgi:hypothetical protein